ncbi:PadR family transcriptional regulator [Novosphingobium mangrovi (ex Huang et al. 2023)]|uniref:PadR family transcriptional regulator n=1 Tax=Novosphingobium mangrovi (ex Huang et al. 2023) TaxID=2976432 RepID=A0ABT2I4E8_9SPHN|nr:PadR family transcriptional regulator [Novosphingobium mangrovi (ex Huang et al. 2023)]MCT2399462.1 PadR family transcriptional regulator [Novosphingobium mangrovi (ex Huang et al. 2023)]
MRNRMFNRGQGRHGCGNDDGMACDEVRSMRNGRGGHGHGVRSPFGGGWGGFGDDFPGRRGGGRGMGHGGGRGPGMRGGRRKRLFDQSELQTLLLALIVEAPRHGYDLIREIETLSGGDYAPSPGVVYPALTYMEESGLIAVVAGESARKSYEATEEGRKQAEVDAEQAVALKARLSALAEQRDKVDPAPVRRAMQALKTSVFDRLSRDGADRELVLQIADAIDEATRKIERIES